MASFEIYIKNYKAQNGNIVSVERLMQTIPMASDPVITNPKVKTDLGKAGSFEFGLEMNSPYYDAMLQMKTILRVVYFGVTIFRGRVLTIDKSFQRSRTVHCEGDLAFLIDSHQIGQKEESRPETDLFTYLTSVIAQHNSDVADAEKRFTLGEVPMNYSKSVLSDQMVNIPADKTIQKYGNSSYDTSMDRLESLLSDFGGYMRTRYDSSNGTVYLDWYDNYYNPYVGQDIEILSNLIDLSGPTEVENLFTVVLPIGKKDNGEVYINEWWPKVRLDHAKVNYITVPELATVPLYSDAELTSGYHRKEDYTNAISRFGRIWKVVEFENANTPQKLFTYAKDWIKNNFMPELTQWDVSALDMRFIDGQTRALYTGDRIKLVHPEVDQNYMYITIISAEYDLYNPDKNKFKIGVPNQQLNASYGVKQKSKGAKSLNNGITDLSSLTNDLEQQINGALAAINRDRDILQQQYILKTTYGHDIGLDDPLAFLVYNTDCITEKDPKEISKNTSKIIQTLEWTKKLKFTELVQSAMQKSLVTGLPVAWNDLQNVIDNTPDVKQQQAAFKTLATNHLINDLDLPTDEAIDLLNYSSALYEAASMVDDNGNWTQKAIDKGALVWNPALKDVYIHAHEVVNNQGSSIGTGILNHAVGWTTSGSLNVNDYLSLDGLTNQFDLGNIINTQDFTDSLTGVSEKIVSMIGGQFDLSEITNTLTGLKNKAVSALGDLFSGTKIEDTVNNLTNKAVSFVDDLFNGTKIENTLTGVKDKAINFIGGLFSGSSKEKDGSADTDKSVNILSGLITGSDQETESTGEKRSFFDILGGLFTGGETKESSAAEALKTFFLGNGVAEIDGENGTAQFGDGYEWMVKINDTVDNKDGFVSAKDFQTFQDIPSFKTQFAAIRTLFANHAELITANVQKLTAVEGYINAISSATVDASKYVSAGYGSFNNLTVNNSLTADSYTANSFKLKVSDGEGGYENAELGACFQSAGTKFENGVWTLVLYKIGGGSQEVPFDLTATDWYTNLVAGKTNEGWDNASAVVDIPKTESTDSRIIFVSTPYSRTYGNNTTRGTETNTYTLRNWNNNQVCLSWDQGHDGDGTIVSVFEHNQYNNGQNAMTASGTWDPHSPQDTTEEKATNTFRYQAYTTDNPPVAKGTQQATTVTLSSGMWIGNKKTVYLKEGSTQLAEFEVDASSLIPSGGGDGTITGIALNPSSKVTYDSTSEMLTVNMQASGTNITNSPFSDSDTLPVSATEVTLTKSNLSNTSTDTHGNTYAGRYYIRKNTGGVFKINQIGTIAASVAQHRLNLELSPPYATPIVWRKEESDGADRYKYTYTVKSGLKLSSGTDTTVKVLSFETETQRLDPADAIEHGFDICHDSISLSGTTQTLSAGDSVTIYPKAKASSSATEATDITGAGITITAAESSGSAPKISTSGWTNGAIKLTADTSGEDEVNISLDIDVAADMSGQDKTNHATITVKDGSSSTGETKKLYMTQGTWNESTNKKIVQLRAGSSSAAVVAESEVDASTRYEAGQQSVTVTSAHILANLIDYTTRPIMGTMSVRLSNMESTESNKALTVNLDDVYKSGLNGGDDYSDTADFEFILTDGEDEWSEYFDDIDVSDIYQHGVDDSTPTPTTVTFIYDPNGNLVTAYSTAKVMPASSDIYGQLYPNTTINYVKDVTVKNATITRTYAECTYYGVTFYVLKSSVSTGTKPNSPSNYGNATGWYSEGTVSYDYNGVVSFDSGNSVTIYSKQSTSSSAVTTVQNEVTVKCMYNPNGYAEEWMPVKYGNYTGYLESKYIYGTNAWNTLHPTVPVLQNISVEWMAHSTSGYAEDVSMLIDTTKGNAETVTCQYWPASAYNAITAQSSVDVIEQYLEHVYLNSFLSHVQLSGMPSQINAKIRLRLTYSGESEDSFINLATTSIGQMVYQYTSTVYADSGSTVNIRSSATGGGSVVTAVPIGATIYCFDNPNGYPETSTYMRVKYGQYEGYMMAKFIVGTDAYNDAYGGGEEPSDPTVTSREISIISVAHMSSTTSVSPISTIFNINTPTYTGEGGVTTLVVNSTAIPTSAYNNYGSGYTKLNSIAGYFSSVRHGSGTYSNALEHGVIFTVTTHYSSGSISSKSYVGYITSNPR